MTRWRARSPTPAAIALLILAPFAAHSAQAQATRAPAAPAQAPAAPAQSARLVLTVTDTSGGVIPTATVTVTGIESATSALPVAPVSTTAQGVATVAGLAPGRYSIRAEFQGLETTTIPDVRLRAGDNRLTMVMALPKLQDSVSVAVDQQTNAADRRQTFGTALTREQIDALSDDPDEMRRQLQEIAGMDAVIRVDSFEGAALPPKAQIKSIHVTRDAFAAENHFAGGLFIDIITQPGIGPVRGGLNFRLRDGSLSGKNPFTVRKGPEQTQNFGGNVGGSIAKERTSFSLSVNGTNSYSTSILNAHVPAGEIAANIPRRVPNDNVFTSALLDHAITKDQTLRISFNQSRFSSSNLGMGQYDLPERAYSTSDNYWGVRLQEVGPLGRRFFINSRLSIGVSDSSSNSLTQAPTIVVTEAFTNGGAQRAGGRHSTQVTAGSDLDYVRGIHSVRAGVALDGYSYRSDDRTNYLGTYTFASLDEYDAGRALSYTQRIGDPLVEYGYMTSAVYLQDDIRLRRNLTISPGVRYEAMLHVNDYDNIGPRFGITWAPFKSGRTSLRGSVGIFYEWMAATTYEQTLRVDGYRQRELNIQNPPFNPDTLSPGEGGFTPPTNRYLFNDDLELQMTKRASVGIDQTLSPRLRVSLTYAFMRGANLWRGQNQNAPVDGVRPDAEFANIVQIVADGRSQQQSLNANFSLNLARLGNAGGAPAAVRAADGPPPPPPPPGAAAASAARLDWRRVSINGNYSYGESLTNVAEGPFGLSPSGTLDTEWGPAAFDVRHRFNIGLNSTQLRNFNANLNLNIASGNPYNIRTGFDDNGDLVFNDRPAGFSRNSARGASQWNLNSNFSYSIPFGGSRTGLPPGIQIIGTGGGAPTVNVVAPQAAARYRLQFIVSAQNLTNNANYTGYSGVMTSSYFGRPTAVTSTRKIDIGMGFSF